MALWLRGALEQIALVGEPLSSFGIEVDDRLAAASTAAQVFR
jgi:hypothetical protein